jgi:hypothetical protein
VCRQHPIQTVPGSLSFGASTFRFLSDKLIRLKMTIDREWLLMDHPLTILFFPYLCHGPVNQCIGMGDVLRRRGHRVIMVVNDAWEGKLTALGLEEYLIDLTKSPDF